MIKAASEVQKGQHFYKMVVGHTDVFWISGNVYNLKQKQLVLK